MPVEENKSLPEHLPVRNYILSVYAEGVEWLKQSMSEKLLDLLKAEPTLEALERLYAYICGVFLGLADSNYPLIEAMAFVESIENKMYGSLFARKENVKTKSLEHNEATVRSFAGEAFKCDDALREHLINEGISQIKTDKYYVKKTATWVEFYYDRPDPLNSRSVHHEKWSDDYNNIMELLPYHGFWYWPYKFEVVSNHWTDVQLRVYDWLSLICGLDATKFARILANPLELAHYLSSGLEKEVDAINKRLKYMHDLREYVDYMWMMVRTRFHRKRYVPHRAYSWYETPSLGTEMWHLMTTKPQESIRNINRNILGLVDESMTVWTGTWVWLMDHTIPKPLSEETVSTHIPKFVFIESPLWAARAGSFVDGFNYLCMGELLHIQNLIKESKDPQAEESPNILPLVIVDIEWTIKMEERYDRTNLFTAVNLAQQANALVVIATDMQWEKFYDICEELRQHGMPFPIIQKKWDLDDLYLAWKTVLAVIDDLPAEEIEKRYGYKWVTHIQV